MLAQDSDSKHPFLAQQIAALTIGDADAPDAFSERLAIENGWSMEAADRIIAEYRRFLILLVTASDTLEPSECVRRAWQLHLLYTRSYWDDLCRETLGRPLHYQLAAVGQEEDRWFAAAYQRTLLCYEAEFGEKPPLDIWPESHMPGDAETVVSLSQRIYRKSATAWFSLYSVVWALAVTAGSLVLEQLISGDCLAPPERGVLCGIVLICLFILAVIFITIHGKPGTHRQPPSENGSDY